MSKLGDKYIAGFLDADGSIEIMWKKGIYKPLLKISFSQATPHDLVLHKIHEENGGYIRFKMVKKRSYSELCLIGKAAEMLLNRIRKHLVVKRHYADAVLSVIEEREAPKDLAATKQWVKEQRRVKSLPVPKHPSRKWLAGYFDGDGCIWTRINKNIHGTYLTFSTGIACSDYDTEGIETICKNFGGQIKPHGKTDRVLQWSTVLCPTKAIKFFVFFGKHSVVKRSQIDFTLACAKMGNYRDAQKIHETMKYLKTCPHRLNEPGVDVAALVEGIERIPSHVWLKNVKPMRQSVQAM